MGATRVIISAATGTAVNPAVLLLSPKISISGSANETTKVYLGLLAGKNDAKVAITFLS